jgi:cation diffusion facilitator family transporter
VQPTRSAAVSRVLVRVLVLNLAVAVAKIAYGYASGALSILSDGFHSLTDSLSNVAALVGVRLSRKPPDADHPYGHRKFETLAAGAIGAGLLLVIAEIARGAWNRFRTGEAVEVGALAFAVMVGTLIVNVFVARYERSRAEALGSEVLLADSMHTRSDVFTSSTVIVALAGVAIGYPVLDLVAAIIVMGFIAHAGWEIATATSDVLADRMVIEAGDLEAVVLSVGGVLGCHHIRTRGSADHVFLDLHIWLDPAMRLDDAHARSHVVKDVLMKRYPQIADAIIHIEPPPPSS